MKKIILAGAFGLAFASTGFAQNGSNYWERLDESHPITTIDSLTNLTSASPKLGEYRLSMVYDGQFRNLSPENLAILQSIGYKKKELKNYKYELLFKYNNQEFWLPVQSDLVEQFQIEMRQDEPVLLYTTVLQTPNKVNQKTLLVEEFKTDLNY